MLGARRELREAYPQSLAAQGAWCADLIRFVTDRPGHDFRYTIDPAAAIESGLGFRPRITLETGIRATVDWYLANLHWWQGRQQAPQDETAVNAPG